MKLSQKDLDAIQSLLHPIEQRLFTVETRINEHFEMTDGHFDALFKSNETLGQEHPIASGQLDRLSARVFDLEE